MVEWASSGSTVYIQALASEKLFDSGCRDGMMQRSMRGR